MKSLKLCSLLFISAIILPSMAMAQSTLGTIRAFSVIGDVSLRNDQTREVVPLTVGREFTEGFTVITGSGSSAVLVQSNGSTIEVTEDSSMSVQEFLQDPYDTSMGRYSRLEADPSNSRTRLKINYGDVTGEVRRLRPGSSYNVDVPTGSAGIRGTIWRVVVRVNLDTGDISVVVTVPEGSVAFESDDGSVTNIDAGQEIEIEGQLAEGSTEEEIVVETFVKSESREAAEESVRQTVQRAIAARQRAQAAQDDEDALDPDDDPDTETEETEEVEERDVTEEVGAAEDDADTTPDEDLTAEIDVSPAGSVTGAN